MDSDDYTVFVKIKLHTVEKIVLHCRIMYCKPLSSIMDLYAGEKNKKARDFDFTYKGHLIDENETPQFWNMKDDDVIEVCQKTKIHIKLRHTVDRRLQGCGIKYLESIITDKMGKYDLVYNGHRIEKDDTPQSLGMHEHDIIECTPKSQDLVKQNSDENTADQTKKIEVKIRNRELHRQMMTFSIWYDGPITNLTRSYSIEVQQPVNNLMFFVGGEEITGNETPKSLGMVDGGIVKVFVKENLVNAPTMAQEEENPSLVALKLCGQNGEELKVRVTYTKTMKDLKALFTDTFRLSPRLLMFKHGDRTVYDHDTPLSLGMKDGDTIETYYEISLRVL